MSADAPLSYQQAIEIVIKHAAALKPSGTERVSLLQSGGRVLAVGVSADRDLPPFPRSTRDGFAVKSAECVRAGVELKIIGEVRAGTPPDEMPRAMGSGECVEIMTGAPLPAAADAVLMYEYATRKGDKITAQRDVHAGENIVPAGAEAHAGDQVLPVGFRLNHAAVAVSASVGWSTHEVYRKPKVIILPTGDEIVEVGTSPGRHQIRNSNSYSLAAQIVEAGAEPMLLPVAQDNPARLRELIGEGLQGDLLLLTGGVSVGKYDFVEQVLADFQAQFHITSVAIQPGKPLVFGDAPATMGDRTRHIPFFGLPGNPVSTMVTFELFVRPVIDALSGAVPRARRFLGAKLASDVRAKTGLTRFLPARLSGEGQETKVELARWQGSGDVVTTAAANCYIVVPPDRDEIKAGELVYILLRGADL
jgi:molybdopterin molybdotransferase